MKKPELQIMQGAPNFRQIRLFSKKPGPTSAEGVEGVCMTYSKNDGIDIRKMPNLTDNRKISSDFVLYSSFEMEG